MKTTATGTNASSRLPPSAENIVLSCELTSRSFTIRAPNMNLFSALLTYSTSSAKATSRSAQADNCFRLLLVFLVCQQLPELFHVARDKLLQHIRRMFIDVGGYRREIGKTPFHRLALDGGLRRRIELGDDVGRRALGREQAVPALRLEIGKTRFRRGRQFRQRSEPHGGADHEPPHHLLIDGLRDGGRRIADAVDLAADGIGERRRGAAAADQRPVAPCALGN